MDFGVKLAQWTQAFRSMFYLCTPYETSYPEVDEVPNYVTQAIPMFIAFTLLEQIALWFQGKQMIRACDGSTSIIAGLFHEISKIFIRSMELRGYIWFWNNYRITELPWDSPWTWILCLLGVDVCYYWFHRLGHEVNLFWAVHVVHHSSEDYNMTTALRLSVLHPYLTWVFYLPMALCIPPSIFLVHVQFNLIYQFWLHTDAIGSLGFLEYLINTPAHHRVHHGRNRYCIDKNFGGILMIWDLMFGTFQMEEEEVVYGVTHPINSFHPVYVQFHHFQHIWETLKRTEGWKDRICVLFMGPGWSPGKPRLGLLEDIPDVHAPTPKFDPFLPMWLKSYYFVHFLIMVTIYHDFAMKHQMVGTLGSILVMTFILYSVYVFAINLEMRPYAVSSELVRIVYFTAFKRWFQMTLPSFLQTFVESYFLFGVILWSMVFGQAIVALCIKRARTASWNKNALVSTKIKIN